MNFIERNIDRLQSDEVLPMNVLFEEVCRLEKLMMKDEDLNGDKCEEYRM
jgi:hypothetical protein